MNELLIGLIGALVATNPPVAVSNLIQQHTGVSVSMINPNNPAETELDQLMAEDDAARAEVDKWIRENNAFAAKGAGESDAELNARIRARLGVMRKKYEDFLRRYPDYARGHLAYGTFLDDIGQGEAAGAEYKKAAELDPKNPAAWNNLGNYYGEFSPVTNAFADYAKAIALDPTEPVYYQNLAVTVYLFRKDAEAYFHINEPQVFDKALALYREALRLDPTNFPLATDYAQSYYGIRPLRTNDALVAWTNALKVARNEFEREGIDIHLARVKILAGRYNEARAQLAGVTNSMYATLKKRLERNIVEGEKAQTNAAAASPSNSPPPPFQNPPTPLKGTPPRKPVLTARPEISTNRSLTPANAALTDAPLLLTNGAPALTNPPPFSHGTAEVLSNVPPAPPEATPLAAGPPTNAP